MPKDTSPIDKETVLREAGQIEADGGRWKIQHVAAVLNCAVSTVYNTPWLLRICKRVGKRGRRWVPAEVRAGQPSTHSNRTGS